MSMLAEPRQRKRYTLVPRGKALFEDDARFGTKMLKKMGWSKDKGLGANEEGSKDFVRVRYKNDAQGFGYEERDDQWTEHEKTFTGLLNSLNADNLANADAAVNSDHDVHAAGFGFAHKSKKLKENFSGESLEEKSKQSKARVHYKKFTRGKDLARYSEKDLANIFGRKTDQNDQIAAATTAVNANDNEPEVKESGVLMLESKLSVSDYFKQKMQQKQLKNAADTAAADDVNKMKKIKNKQHQLKESPENAVAAKEEIKRKANTSDNSVENCNEHKSKKKKSKKNQIEPTDETAISNESAPLSKEEKKLLKKRAKKLALEQLSAINESSTDIVIENCVHKKAKKRVLEDDEKFDQKNSKKSKLKQKGALVANADEVITQMQNAKNINEAKASEHETSNAENEQKFIKSNLSVNEYFEQKMQQLKEKQKKAINNSNSLSNNNETNVRANNFVLKQNQFEIEKNKIETEKTKEKKTDKKIKKDKTLNKTSEKTINIEMAKNSQSDNLQLKQLEEECIEAIDVVDKKAQVKKVKKQKKSKKMALTDTVEVDIVAKEAEPEQGTTDLIADDELAKKPQKTKSKKTVRSTDTSDSEQNANDSSDDQAAVENIDEMERPKCSTNMADKDFLQKAAETSPAAATYLQQLKSYNKCTISSFTAEKFANIDLSMFPGSNLSEINGYGFNANSEMEIKVLKNDENRIMRLWSCTVDKYRARKSQQTLCKYVDQISASNNKRKTLLKFRIKAWKRKQAFQGI